MSFRPGAIRGDAAGTPRGASTTAWRARSLIRSSSKGRLAQHEVCDAHPELRARGAGRAASRPAIAARSARTPTLRLVTLRLRAPAPGARALRHLEGRAAQARPALRRVRRCYVVEVCPSCSWNHLARTYPSRPERRPDRVCDPVPQLADRADRRRLHGRGHAPGGRRQAPAPRRRASRRPARAEGPASRPPRRAAAAGPGPGGSARAAGSSSSWPSPPSARRFTWSATRSTCRRPRRRCRRRSSASPTSTERLRPPTTRSPSSAPAENRVTVTYDQMPADHGAGRARRRGPQLLRARRHRPGRHRPRAVPGPRATTASQQGGSTITQQYVKNVYLTDERTPTASSRRRCSRSSSSGSSKERDPRALPQQDLLRSRRLRRRGGVAGLLRQGRRGPQPAEAAYLAGLIRCPGDGRRRPRRDPTEAEQPATADRRARVLDAMLSEGYITAGAATTRAGGRRLEPTCVRRRHGRSRLRHGRRRRARHRVLHRVGPPAAG